MSLYEELKRRNVLRVATAYIVAAWLIIQVVETTFPAFGFSDGALRLAIIVLAIGFIPVVIGSWVLQLTPEGIRLDTDGAVSQAADGQSGRWLDRAIIVFLVLGISYFAFDKFVLAPERAAKSEAEAVEQARAEAIVGFYGDRSIAVIPFDNMTSDPEQEYFVDGIAEEVLNLLARIRELRVISRSSAFAFKGQNLEIPDIAERLGVAHILEGSVRRAGNRVRVTAQLIEARTDTHLWSKTYEREFENVFAIQDEIAADVARNLELTLLEPLPRSHYVDPEVIALTAQAKQLAEVRNPNVGNDMYELLSQALEIDPNYVPAMEWMMSANFFRANAGVISREEDDRLGQELTRRILAIEPDNAMVDISMAWESAYLSNDLEKAAFLFERALEKDLSNSNHVRIAGGFARSIGRIELAERLMEHAVAIDPLCYQCLYHLSRTYIYSGRYEESLKARERYLKLGTGGEYHYGLTLLLQGKAEQARQHFATADLREDRVRAGTAMALYSLGEFEAADQHLAALIAFEGGLEPELIAEVAAWQNKTDLAFEKIEEIVEQGRIWVSLDLGLPVFRNLHSDPRWEALLTRMGWGPERLAALEFDPDLPE